MTNTINEYSSGVFLPNYITTDYNNDLEIALLLKKQNEYDTNLQKLNSLQSTALNIDMINKKGRAKLDAYNSELNQLLAQDLGDLTDPTVQAKVAGYFTKISSDADLKQRSRLSQEYIKQNNTIEIERSRAMKDPNKSGYSQINEYVYRNFEGGENSFINADDVTDWNQKMELYTPYKNVDNKLINAMKLLHEETKSMTVPDNKGRLITVTEEGITKERLMKLYPTLLDQSDMDQINVLSKYQILTQDRGSLYESYNNWVGQNVQSNQKRIDRLNGEIAEYDDSKIPENLTAEQKAVKLEEFKAKREMAQEELDELTRSNKRLNAELKKTPEEFNTMGQRDLVPFISQQMYEQKIGKVADALSYMSTVQGVTADQAWLTERRIQAAESIEQHKARMEAMKDEAKNAPIFSDPATQTLGAEEAELAYQEMVDDNIRLKGVTTNIFEGVSDEQMMKNLKDPNYIKGKKDNHYYKLWDKYSTGNSEATVEGFKAYLKSVEEGNYIQDASVQGEYEQLIRDKQVFNYQSKKVDELLTKSKQAEGGDPLDVALSDGRKLRDYEKDGKFAIPLEAKRPGQAYTGGYKYMTWEEIKKEYYGKPPIGTGVMGEDETYKRAILTFPTSILRNDSYLYELIEKGVKQSEKVYGRMIKLYDEERQANAQYQQRTLDLGVGKNKTYAATNIIPSINQYYSVSVGDSESDRTEINLSVDDIQLINVPTSGGKASFVLSDKGKKRLLGKTLVTPSGETIVISEDMAGANEFRFDYQSANSYDYMYNQMFKEEKYLMDMHKGHKIEFFGYQSDPNSIKVVVTDPTGKKTAQQIQYTGDINDIRMNTRVIVDNILVAAKN
jgi:hypothetical protein